MWRPGLPIVALVCSVALGAQAPRRLLPVDEATTHPDFFAFRARLITAVAERNAAAILAVVHPGIKSSFGGDHGIADFKQMWTLDSSESEFWQEFGTVLALGGTFDGPDRFVAPYTFARWPDDLDAFEHLAMVGSGIGCSRPSSV